jgi:ribosome biogenesis ATPase
MLVFIVHIVLRNLQELGVPLINVAGPELVAGVSGESEERIRDLFDQAAENAPCILFLDEVDALAPSRHTAQREMERRIVAQLLSCLDGRSYVLCKYRPSSYSSDLID